MYVPTSDCENIHSMYSSNTCRVIDYAFLSSMIDTLSLSVGYSADFKIPLRKLREIHSRRFNMSRTALEIFLVDQTNYFINFQEKKVTIINSTSSPLHSPPLVLLVLFTLHSPLLIPPSPSPDVDVISDHLSPPLVGEHSLQHNPLPSSSKPQQSRD